MSPLMCKSERDECIKSRSITPSFQCSAQDLNKLPRSGMTHTLNARTCKSAQPKCPLPTITLLSKRKQKNKMRLKITTIGHNAI